MKYILPAIIGAIIGYLTNYLAIKMLFRPYEEVKIFGLRVPFTPGLIPKEKPRIAKSVGEAIGNHLLSKDIIINSLCSKNMNNHFKQFINNSILKLKNKNTSIKDVVLVLSKDNSLEISKDNSSKIKKYISIKLNGYLVGALRDEKNINKLDKVVKKAVNEKFNLPLTNIIKEEDKSLMNSKLNSLIKNYKDSKEFKNAIKGVLVEKEKNLENSDVLFKDVIPVSAISSLKVFIFNKKDVICEEISEIIKKDSVKSKMKQEINSAITGLSPMIAMFINSDTVYNKIMDEGDKYLKDDKNKVEVALGINSLVDKLNENKISSILKESPEEGKLDIIENISNMIINNIIQDENMLVLVESLVNKIDLNSTLDDIAKDSSSSIKDRISSEIIKSIKNIIFKDDLEDKINPIIEQGVEKALDINISEVVAVENNIMDSMEDSIINIFNTFIENNAGSFIEAFNIPKVVENNINSFDMVFAEKIIMDIAKKELAAITWLGALLGGMIGLIVPILSAI